MAPTTRSKTGSVATDSTTADQSNDSHIRLRQTASGAKSNSKSSTRSSIYDEPPRFVIDLSLPPEQRYLEVCAAYKDKIRTLTPLFEEVTSRISRFISLTWLTRLSKAFLRRVYDEEENRELKSISKATGVDMYLLVCFNVLLDLFMGCSSGGAAVKDGNTGSKMVHFRTLDWGMPSLRQVVIQLDFKTETDGPIVASSITYAGYVGVLTGVRKGFSLSLNFRPNRQDKGKWLADARYYWHLIMVLFGRRRSISSQLRQCLLPRRVSTKSEKESDWTLASYAGVVNKLGGGHAQQKALTTTACYLCFCNGRETTVMEKDRTSAVVRTDEEIIVVTNNDVGLEGKEPEGTEEHGLFAAALKEIVEEAKDRRECAQDNYRLMRESKARQLGITNLKRALETKDIVALVKRYPTLNEMTHFACVMDPKEGTVRWCRRWTEPISDKWIREHPSYE